MAIKTILVEVNAQIGAHLIPTMQEMAWIDVVAIAETQDEAIRAAQQHDDWQLMVIDLFLREGSGLGVLRQLKGRRLGQAALVLTNYPASDVRRRCMKCEADGFFDKSIELDAFFERCSTLPGGRFPGRS